MTNFIPIFPLGIVVYPGEELNLHIFESRYKQLIKECAAEQKPFGIPPVINKKMGELGTLVKITEIVKTYESGEMDIRTKGISIFRILEIIKSIPEKLYSGAIVNYPDNEEKGNEILMKKVVGSLREMHRLLKISKNFQKPDLDLSAYDIAHHSGLTIEQEYELLALTREIQRQEYLKRHFKKAIPILNQGEMLKEKIKLNGHFKNLDSFDLNI